MQSKARLFGHPIHPMLIVYPLGLFGTAVVFDIIYFFTGQAGAAVTSYWMIAAGVVGGLAAAVFGTIDWIAIPKGTRAKKLGAWHGIGNVVVVALFAASWFARGDYHLATPVSAMVLGIIGVAIAVVTGWMGGELVDRLGVGVDEGAHVNAPSSLSGRPAREQHTTAGSTAGPTVRS
ncbi:MAG: DUF2231 domain-containing protein [Gemmatimonadaceae bacterium]